MGGSHDGVFRIRPWFCRVNFKLDILHHHGEEYEDAALGQRFSQAYPLSDSKWGELESNGMIYILPLQKMEVLAVYLYLLIFNQRSIRTEKTFW